jgi:hypothetical protein
MADTWLYLAHPKSGERVAVRPADYQAKHEAGFRLDPEVGDQEAPKLDKPAKKDGE